MNRYIYLFILAIFSFVCSVQAQQTNEEEEKEALRKAGLEMKQKIDRYLQQNSQSQSISAAPVEDNSYKLDSLAYVIQYQKYVIDSLTNMILIRGYNKGRPGKKNQKIATSPPPPPPPVYTPKPRPAASVVAFTKKDSIQIYFEPDIFKLDYIAIKQIDSVLQLLKDKNITLKGVTEVGGRDRKQINLALLRADDVREYLLSKGIKPQAIMEDPLDTCAASNPNSRKFESCRMVKIYWD